VKNLNIAVIGDGELAGRLGKKGTESDIALFNYKREDVALTFITPARYPERLSSLLLCITMSDYALVVVSEFNAGLGEVLVALDAWDARRGCFIMKNYLQPEQLRPMLAGTALEGYEFLTEGPGNPVDPVALREKLTGLAEEMDAAREMGGSKEGAPVIPVDHFFNVKGIGLVILGCVTSGKVKRHDKLTVHPTGKVCTVRSIQTHDRDVNEAFAGDRVGLALRGIEYEDMDRGYVLSAEAGVRTGDELILSVKKSPYWKMDIGTGAVLHLCCGMQFLPCRVTDTVVPADPTAGETGREAEGEVKGETGRSDQEWESMLLQVKLDRPIVLEEDSRVFVCWLEGKGLRVMGSGIPRKVPSMDN